MKSPPFTIATINLFPKIKTAAFRRVNFFQIHRLEKIAIQRRLDEFFYQSETQTKPGLLLFSGQIQRDDRNLMESRFIQSVADDVKVVSRAAGTARLGNQKSDAIRIVAAMFQRADQLPDDQNAGIADIVMAIAESGIGDIYVSVIQNFGGIIRCDESRGDEIKMVLHHLRDQNRMGPSHSFCVSGAVHRNIISLKPA